MKERIEKTIIIDEQDYNGTVARIVAPPFANSKDKPTLADAVEGKR